MVANGDGRKQVAVLELGWTTDKVNPDYAWHAVDEATQADYLVRAYQYAAEHWRPWMGLMTTIYIADWEWTPENEQLVGHRPARRHPPPSLLRAQRDDERVVIRRLGRLGRLKNLTQRSQRTPSTQKEILLCVLSALCDLCVRFFF